MCRYNDEVIEETDENGYYVETVSPSRRPWGIPLAKFRTGLTQSDLSLSSMQNYRYSNQQEYEYGNCGYSHGYHYVQNEPSDKPKIVSGIYKTKSANNIEDTAVCIENDSVSTATLPF